MPNIDIDQEFIDIFYNITGANPPADVTLVELKKQLVNIVDTLKNIDLSGVVNKTLQDEEEESENKGPAILIVDDLGVITYQLKVLLSVFDYDIDCSQEIYDAVNKFKKRHYQYVVMDLFIPTEREGFILLTELRKMAQASNTKTIIGVITASPRKEIEQQCRLRGADFFLEKSNDWQNSLYQIMDGYINTEHKDENY